MELPSKANIERVSMEILKQSKALDVFPTPVDQIIRFTELTLDSDVDLSSIEKSFLVRLSEKVQMKFNNTMSQIRGILDRQEKIIYLDLSQSEFRQNFVKLHEVGHHALTWQDKILACLDNDQTLDPYITEEFEAEANYFASTTLFQLDRFESEMDKLGLGIKSPMALANIFGSSRHAALRRYVECSKNRCALLVLEGVSKVGEKPQCHKRNYFCSSAFIETFGNIDLPEQFGYSWQFAKDYYHGRRLHENGEITLSTQNGEADFTYHFFNNTYNAFVFIFPVGEHKSSRTKIIVSG